MDPIYGDVQPPKKETKVEYWSPELRVFEFPNLDASPTVEEFEMLLDIPVLDRSKIYLFTGDHELKEEYIEEVIGTLPGVQNIIRQGKFEGLKWTYLKKHIIKMEEQKNWKSFGSSFALSIYGLVLFPFVADMLDRETLDVFYKVNRFSINPVPTVLAETLLQFHKGHQVAKERTKIRYCVQLLYVCPYLVLKPSDQALPPPKKSGDRTTARLSKTRLKRRRAPSKLTTLPTNGL
ncbi:hypothetical protein Lal_00039185 [Lupinus albus]|nr:hypothetical protein Lal_00039185 [Lupinus albus]